MTGRWIEIAAEDGGKFEGYLSLPPTGAGPGLVLVQEIFGVDATMRGMADMFAAEGYAVLVPDLFWRFEPHIEIPFDDAGLKRAFGYYETYDYDVGVRDIGSAIAALRGMDCCNGAMAVSGFCMGGTFAYLAATRLEIDAAVGYYGTMIHKYLGEAGKVRCPLLLHFGEKDHTTPPDILSKITDALGKRERVRIEVYPGAQHAFANPMRPSYDAAAAKLAHSRTLAFIGAAVA